MTRPSRVLWLLAAIAPGLQLTLSAANFDFCNVEKSRWFTQADPSTLVPATRTVLGPNVYIEGAFEFFAMVAQRDAINSAQVTIPGGTPAPMLPDPNNVTGLFKYQDFATQAAMDSVYQDGQYTFNVDTIAAGPVTRTLNLQGAYPNAPEFSNYTAAQDVDASEDFTLSFNAFAGLAPDDQIFINVLDPSGFRAYGWYYDFNDPGTSVVIPAGTLSPGVEYTAQVIFLKAADRLQMPEPNFELNLVDFVSGTSMRLATTPPDVSLYIVEKSHWHRQTGPATVVEAVESPGLFGTVNGAYEFYSTVTFGAGGAANTASVQIPSGGTRSMSHFPAPDMFATFESFPTRAAMDAAIPNGDFTMQATAGAGAPHSAVLTLSGDAYPPVPQFSNYTAAQAVDAEQPFALTWTTFAGATGDDVILFRIFNASGAVVFETPASGPNALGIGSVSKDLPANTLQPGQTYTAQLLFFKTVDLEFAAIPNALGVAEYGSVTSMEIRTLQCAAPPEDLVNWWRGEGDLLDSRGGFNGAAGGTMAYVAGRAGQAFQTQNGYVRVPDHPRLRPAQLTVAMWLKGPPGDFDYAISKSHNGTLSSYAMYSGVGGVAFYITAGGAARTISAPVSWGNNWRHIAASYDGSALRLYVDGTLAAGPIAVNLPIQYSSQAYGGDLLIGGIYPGNATYYWPGAIDEVMIMDRAVSAAEISSLYAAGAAGACRGPIITSFPADQTVLVGSSPQFAVSATSPLPLRYQWQRDRVNLVGETNPTLTLAAVRADQAGRYRVIVSDDTGSTTTAEVALQVDACVAPPANLAAWWRGEGDTVERVSGLSGAPGATLAYAPGQAGQSFRTSGGYLRVADHASLRPAAQVTLSAWVRGNAGIYNYIFAKSYGANAASYALSTDAVGGLRFYAIIAGSVRTASSSIYMDERWRHVVGTYDGTAVRLYVDGALVGGPVAASGSITYANTYNSGDLFIGAIYPETPSYFWAGDIDEPMIFSRALTTPEIAGMYNARSAGLCRLPAVAQHPIAQNVVVGANVTFEVTASSPLPLRYQWQFNEADLPGQTDRTLTLNAVTLALAGRYRVIVTDDEGSVLSNDAVLEVEACVLPPANLVARWKGDGGAADSFQGLTSVAEPGLVYAEGKVGQAMQTANGVVRVANNPALSPAKLTVTAWVKRGPAAGGFAVTKFFDPFYSPSYSIKATSTTLSFVLATGGWWDEVSIPMTWDNQWTHVVGTYDGVTARMYVNGVLAGTPVVLNAPIDYGNFYDNGDLFIGGYTRTVPEQPQFNWPGLLDDVMIFNRALSAGEIAGLYEAGAASICNGISIFRQPAAQTISAGSTARFDMGVASAAAVDIAWQRNGQTIAAGPTLTIPNAQLANAGRYRAVISNADGTVYSEDAELVVTSPVTPAFAGGIATGGDARRVHVVGNFAYVANVSSGFRIVDVTDKASPQLRGSLPARSTTWDVKVIGTIAYIADGGAGLQLVNVSDPNAPTRLGEADTQGSANGIDVVGNYAYIADGFSGFAVIDVANPSSPQGVGTVDTPGNANHVHVVGNYAYVADMDRGLQIIDISVPTNPRIVGARDTNGEAIDISVSGNYAFLAHGATGLMIIDISNPTNPTELTTLDTAGQALAIHVQGRYAFIADFNDGLKVIDIQNPAAPTLAYNYNTPGDGRGIFVDGNYAYVADGNSGLQIIRISETLLPPTITLGPVAQTVLRGQAAQFGVTVSGTGPFTYQWQYNGANLDGQTGSTLAIANATPQNTGRYRVIVSNALGSATSPEADLAVSTPVQPVLVGSVDAPGWARAVYVLGNHAYVADGSPGLRIIDISDPANPQLRSTMPELSFTRGVKVVGSIAYVADSASGLQLIDVSDPSNPQRLGAADTAGAAHGVDIIGNYAYVADGGAGFAVVDISNPGNPQIVGTVDTPGTGFAVQVVGNYAYMADTDSVQIIDVSVPANPRIVGSRPTTGFAYGISVAGNHAFVADTGAGLLVLDISNPANPTQAAIVPAGNPHGLYVLGNYAFVADYEGGLRVFDVTNPASPSQAYRLVLPSPALGIFARGNYAYLAVDHVGLRVIRIAELTAPRSVEQWRQLGASSDGRYLIDPDGPGGSPAFYVNGIMSLSGGGWTQLTDSTAATALNTGNHPREYLYVKDGTPLWCRTPGSTLVWNWSQGTDLYGNYTASDGTREQIFAVTPSAERQAYGVGGSSGPGPQNKCLIIYDGNCLDPGNARAMVCHHVPGMPAWQENCQCGFTIYIRETESLVITQQPASQTLPAGSIARFSVAVASALPLQYQWQFNRENIPGETTADLMLNNVTEARQGAYRVIVSNASGSVTSEEAMLVVDQCVTPPDALEGYWPADGVLLNYAGDTLGELRGDAVFGEGISGGLGFRFDSGADTISLSPEQGNFGSANFSVAFWLRSAFPGDASTQVFVSKQAVNGPGFSIYGWSGSFWFAVEDPALGMSMGAQSFATGSWHHFVCVRKQDRLEIYVDGQLSNEAPAPEARANVNNGAELLLGGGSGQRVFSQMDELMLFRRALTPGEISAIYGSGVAGLCPIPVAPAVGQPVGGGEIAAGTFWTLYSVADGAGPFTYEWRRNGVIIPGATGANYQLIGVTAADAGDYYVVVTGPYGIRASSPTRLQVMAPPTVAIAPASQSIRVGPGNRLLIQSTFAGNGPFAFQWTRNNAILPGANSPQLEISPTTADLAGAYRLVVTSEFGQASSEPAIVTIAPALQVTRPPANVQTGEGNPLDLSVEVAGTGPFEFQWRLNGQNIPGATLANYHLDSMALQNAGQYTVAVTDPGGAVTSDPAEVTLVSVISVEPADAFANAFSLNGQPPKIRTSNIDATREVGEPEHADKPGQHSIWFSWLAPADGQLEIKTIGSSFDTLLGIYKGAAFPLESVAIGDDEGGFSTSATVANVESGIRYFIAIDGLGDARGTVLLTWAFRAASPAPSIRVQPESVTTTIGSLVRLSIDARNVETYQWRRNGGIIAGANAPDYTIPSVQRPDLGIYDVVLTGGGVSVTSQPVEIQVGTDAEVLAFDKLFDRLDSIDIAAPAPIRAAAPERDSPPRAAAGFGSAAAARGFVGVPGSHEDSTVGASRDPGEPNHAGEAGGASTWFVIQADADATMEVTTDGSDFDTVLAVYSGPPTVLAFSQIQLRAADNNSGANGRASRVVIPVTRNAFYYCAVDGVQGAQGFVQINYRLGLAPIIQENPAPQTVLARGAALMRGSALNAAPQNLRWYFNGAPIAGQVGEELRLADVQPTDHGVYTVVAETFAGRAVSQPAALTVLPAQPLRVSAPTIGANGIRVRVQGGSARPIRAQASGNLTSWVEVPVEILPDGTVIVGPAPGLAPGAQFFRIIQ